VKTKEELAVGKFLEGYNCAQAVLYAFCKESRIDENTALKMACGFGTGMGGNEEVCGAVSGGIIVIGSKYGRGKDDDLVAKELTYSKTRELMARFSQKHGTYICRNLLNGCDLSTEDGKKCFKESGLLHKKCKVCVESVVKILEDIL